MSPPKPGILLAHLSGLQLFSVDELSRLGALGTLLDVEPLGQWDDPRADDLLSRADVLLGHWGCPPVDAAVLDRAPNLGLIAYAAGSLKGTVGPEVFDRGYASRQEPTPTPSRSPSSPSPPSSSPTRT